MEIVLYVFAAYVGIALAVLLFGPDERAERAERALKELLGLIKKNGGST